VGALLRLGQMSQPNLSVSVYQLRIALLRTSPHIWRRVLVPGHFTLAQLHQILRALFGWSETHPHRFLIRAKSFNGDQLGTSAETTAARSSDFQFYLRERFLYEYRYDLRAALWRHEIRIEKTLSLQEQWPYHDASPGPALRRRSRSPARKSSVTCRICSRLVISFTTWRR
jgi:hypothetical protein